MRTTIALDDDAYELASLYAVGRGITLSAAINEAVRRIAEPSASRSQSRITTRPNGMPVFVSSDRILTTEMVKAGQEDDLE